MLQPRRIALLLALVTLGVFLPVMSYQFVCYDDYDYVVNNHMVLAGWTLAGFKWAFTVGYANNWHPLTWLSHMTDCELFKLNAGAHHLTSVLFHATNAALLFTLMLRLTGKKWPSAFIAALFAWHPLHVESVAWVAERKDVLSTFFALLALLAYVKFSELSKAQNPKSKVYYSLSLLAFACGLMSKPMLVTLPFVMLLLDFWPLERIASAQSLAVSSWRLVYEKWPFFLLTVAACLLTFRAQSATYAGHTAVVPLKLLPLSFRLGDMALAYVGYLGKFIWPENLAVFYPRPDILLIPVVAADTLILLVISSIAWCWRKPRPYFLMGWLWFVGMLVPVSGLVQVGGAGMADRYSYLPLVGIFIIITFAADEIAVRFPSMRKFICAGAVLALAGCIFATEKQLPYWKNSAVLFQHDLVAAGDNDVAHNNLGTLLEEQSDWGGALAQYQAAIHAEPKQAITHSNLGSLLDRLGRPAEALQEYRAAIELQPDDPALHISAGHELNALGQFNAALEELAIAKNLDPHSSRLHVETARACFKLGRDQEGLDEFRTALRIAPDDYQILAEASHYLAVNENVNARNGKLALDLALKADELSGHSQAMVFDALGSALAENGDFTKAVICAQKALDLAAAAHMEKLEPLRQRLELYQSHKPWHESFRATNAPAVN